MIVLKPMFINANYEKIFDEELIDMEWQFIIDSITAHCKNFEYDKADGFKIWWWAVDDDKVEVEDKVEDKDEVEDEVEDKVEDEGYGGARRTCIININGIEPTEQHINRFRTNTIEKKMEPGHPRYSDEFDTLYLTFEPIIMNE